MEKVIVAISREYGSGGRMIGEKVSAQLGIPFYNHNLIDMVAHETGMAADYISNWEEQVSSPRIWGVPAMRGAGAAVISSMNYYSNEERMFRAQSKIIRDIAAKGSCVIVGRCADYILRNDPACLRVFVYSDKQIRIKRVMEEYGADSEEEALRRVRAVDRGRAAYHKKYADHVWGNCHDYHISIDSGLLGVELCAQVISRIAGECRREGNDGR